MKGKKKSSMYTFVSREHSDLRIPAEKVEAMLHALIPLYEAGYGPFPLASARGTSPAKTLTLLLRGAGYDTSEEEQGDIVIEDCVQEKLDAEEDPVLCALAGITPSGSYLTFYGDDNSQWQIRYDNTQKWRVRGEVVFPPEPSPFPCAFEPGN